MLDENGILNPVMGEDSSAGDFQVNLYGTKKGYRELGRYFLALAELDTKKDDGFHEHHDDLAISLTLAAWQSTRGINQLMDCNNLSSGPRPGFV